MSLHKSVSVQSGSIENIRWWQIVQTTVKTGLASYQIVILAGITLLAALLRFYKLGEWSFWIDEIYTILDAPDALMNLFSWPLSRPKFSAILTNAVISTWGINEWNARLAPALLGIISIPLLYFPVKRLFGWPTALISVLLLALSPWHLYWSQNARFYTSMMLFYTLALFAFFFAVEKNRLGTFLVAFILAIFAIERLTSLIFIPVMIAYLLAVQWLPFERPPFLRKYGSLFQKSLLALLILGVLFALYDAYRFSASGSSYTIDILQSTNLSWFLGSPGHYPASLLVYTVTSIGIPFIVLGFFGGVFLVMERNRAGLFLLIGAVLPLVLLIAVSPFAFTKDRYVFVTLPFWIILSAVACRTLFSITKQQTTLLAAGVLCLLLADMGASNLLYYRVHDGHRLDWKGAYALIEAEGNTEDVVVSNRSEIGVHYLGRDVIQYGNISPKEVMESGQKHWFVFEDFAVFENSSLQHWILEHGELKNIHSLQLPDEETLYLYLYDPASRRISLQPE